MKIESNSSLQLPSVVTPQVSPAFLKEMFNCLTSQIQTDREAQEKANQEFQKSISGE